MARQKRDDGGKAPIVDVPPGFHIPPVLLVFAKQNGEKSPGTKEMENSHLVPTNW